MAIRKLDDGYEVSVPVGRYDDGRVKYKRELADTQKDANRREKELLLEIRDAVLQMRPQEKPKSRKLFAIAAAEWLDNKKDDVAIKTYKRYKGITDTHLIPRFGNMPVNEITEEDIRQYFKKHSCCGTTLRQHYVILDNVLRTEGLETFKNIPRPTRNDPGMNCIKDPQELAEFIFTFQGTTMFLPAYIAANTGMRFSEVAGLQWNDIDLNNGYVTMNKSLHWEYDDDGKKYWYLAKTKTKNSRRTIRINPHDVVVLKEAKEKQGGRHSDFVCMDSRGLPISKNSQGTNFRKSAKSKGYDISFHSLRHSHATILIMIYKIPIVTVSKRLGHSDVTVTLNIYTSVIHEQDEVAAGAMEDVFSEAEKNTKKHNELDPDEKE